MTTYSDSMQLIYADYDDERYPCGCCRCCGCTCFTCYGCGKRQKGYSDSIGVYNFELDVELCKPCNALIDEEDNVTDETNDSKPETTETKSNFRICDERAYHKDRCRGFQLTFANGYCISVQWGTRNYCETRHDAVTDSSPDAEVAVWNGSSPHWTSFGYDGVRGWLSTDDVGKLIAAVVALPADRHPKTVLWEQQEDGSWTATERKPEPEED